MRVFSFGSATDRVSQRIEFRETPQPRSPGAPAPLRRLEPLRQAQRLPIRALNMLTAHGAHLLHPDYLQPLDAKKSPLALLAQTCSQIGKSEPPSSKVTPSEKDPSGRSSGLKSSTDDKSNFKPYGKGVGDGRREPLVTSTSSSTKDAFRFPSANVANGTSNGEQQRAYTPRAASPWAGSITPPSAHSPSEDSSHQQDSPSSTSSNHPSRDCDGEKHRSESPRHSDSAYIRASANGSNGSVDQDVGKPGRVTPISPYRTNQPLFPLPSPSMAYHGSMVGGYTGYPSQFVTGLDPTKTGLKHPSPPPSFLQGVCRDPYCLSYPGVSPPCVHDPSLKTSFPLVYPHHLSHPLYSYGFLLPTDPLPHACNWVSAGGPCDKRFPTPDELLVHLRAHTAPPGPPPGMDGKLLSGHIHLPHQSGLGSLSLRAPPTLSLARYHPYSKLPPPCGPSPLTLNPPYYPHYALYAQRLGAASALGYQ
ncbi:zinc finger protein 703-like isoform X2 [Gouania willdenowi]|uniref:zinc finger protein 703-like isoform X2 n=1 Tax=Gouania willdenowi TaxID=441366 RepID=UPI0010567157|nr:zinc finger protein 703-like isoform X2 [Gouania willdenowi]